MEFVANFVSIMNEAFILEFEFRGVLKQVKYYLELSPGYAGRPIFYLIDKHGHNHSFVRGAVGGWHRLGKASDWPSEFLASLYNALENEYLKRKR